MKKQGQLIHAPILYLLHRPPLASMSAIWDNALPFLEQVFKTDLSEFEVSKGQRWEGARRVESHVHKFTSYSISRTRQPTMDIIKT